MLAPVSMHVVLETTGADRFALIYDVLFCHAASPSSTKGFSIGRMTDLPLKGTKKRKMQKNRESMRQKMVQN